MQVKCLICGKLIDKKTAYCVQTTSKNNYYCSEEEYLTQKRAKEAYNDALTVITGCYQYCTGYAEPPYNLIRKELADNLKAIPIATIKAFVEENKEKLKKTIDRKIETSGQFQAFYFEVRYISGIIKREILEKQWKESKPEPPAIIKNAGDTNYYEVTGGVTPQTRRPLSILMENIIDGD